jgi:hypothetical protein
MKQFFTLCFLVMMAGWAQAQVQASSAAPKASCCASKAGASSCASKSASTTAAVEMTDPAALAAAADESIQSRVNANTGETVYMQRQVASETGAVTYQVVEYSADLNAFVAPNAIATAECSKSGGEKAGCCASKAEAGDTKAQNAETRPVRRSSTVKLVNNNQNQ